MKLEWIIETFQARQGRSSGRSDQDLNPGILLPDRLTPAAVLIRKACGIEKGSSVPNQDKVASISRAQLLEIAQTKRPDLNAVDDDAAIAIIAGTARSMGVTVEN